MLLKIPTRLIHLLVHLLVQFYNFTRRAPLLFKTENQPINLYTNLYTCMIICIATCMVVAFINNNIIIFSCIVVFFNLYTCRKCNPDKVVCEMEAFFSVGTKDAGNARA